MTTTIQTIPLTNLALAFIPPLIMIAIMFSWSLKSGKALYAMGRMLGQLLLIGYFLTYIFQTNQSYLVLAILGVMILASSWIALGNIQHKTPTHYAHILLSIALAGGFTLAIIILGVLKPTPWHTPQTLIPLAGMIFANAMNSLSLTAERLSAELNHGNNWQTARTTALNASLIPQINALLAVGLVSLPGMMTGQILSGVSPLIAVRYQIMVMCMIFGAAGLASVLYLLLTKKHYTSE